MEQKIWNAFADQDIRIIICTRPRRFGRPQPPMDRSLITEQSAPSPPPPSPQSPPSTEQNLEDFATAEQ
jgi:hypothetical protein